MECEQQAGASESFDQVLERLREVVERLEGGNLSLEDSLRVFEEGVRLSRRGAQILDAAEKRVEILLQHGEAARVEPFNTEGPGDTAEDDAASRVKRKDA